MMDNDIIEEKETEDNTEDNTEERVISKRYKHGRRIFNAADPDRKPRAEIGEMAPMLAAAALLVLLIAGLTGLLFAPVW